MKSPLTECDSMQSEGLEGPRGHGHFPWKSTHQDRKNTQAFFRNLRVSFRNEMDSHLVFCITCTKKSAVTFNINIVL